MTTPTHDQIAAERLDLVEDLYGHRVADPYRWLEDAKSDQTRAWSEAQDALYASARASWPGLDRLRGRLGELLSAGMITPPIWRGERQFLMRRTAEQEHAVLLTIDPDGTERTLIDPMALDPSGLTTLDTWQPSKEGDLLAYQVSEGGTEESVVRVMDVVTGALARRPDRPGPLLAHRLAAGRRGLLLRTPAGARAGARRARSSSTAGSGCTASAPTRPRTCSSSARGARPPSTSASRSRRDGRWLVVSASEGTAPRNDLWLADLEASPLEAPVLVPVQIDVDAQTGVEVGRDGRLYVFTDLDAPRGPRLRDRPPTSPTVEHWRELLPQDDVAVLDGFAILDGAELDRPVLLASWTRHAVSRADACTTSRPGTRTGDGRRCPGSGSIGGVVERPEGGHEAWFGYTDHTTPTSACSATTRVPASRRAVGQRARHRRRCPPCTTRQVGVRVGGRHHGPHVRAAGRRARPTGRGRRSCTATAASACR